MRRRQLTSPRPRSAALGTPSVQQGKDPLIGRGLTRQQRPESPTLTKCRLSVCLELTKSDLPRLPFSAVAQPEAHASVAHGDRSGGTPVPSNKTFIPPPAHRGADKHAATREPDGEQVTGGCGRQQRRRRPSQGERPEPPLRTAAGAFTFTALSHCRQSVLVRAALPPAPGAAFSFERGGASCEAGSEGALRKADHVRQTWRHSGPRTFIVVSDAL